METRTREKIALVVLVLLALFGAAVLVSYIFAGHSWNFVASDIDDAVGSMDGYAVVVYQGTTEASVREQNDPLDELLEESFVDIAAVEASYLEKEATVLEIDTLNPQKYDEGMILYRDGRRFGVLYAEWLTSRVVVQAQVDSLVAQSVDYVIVLAQGRLVVEGLQGVDIGISLQDEDIISVGTTTNGIFRVQTPQVGDVGVILISPSNVVSAKTITEL